VYQGLRKTRAKCTLKTLIILSLMLPKARKSLFLFACNNRQFSFHKDSACSKLYYFSYVTPRLVFPEIIPSV
jgi:hypothetical protein